MLTPGAVSWLRRTGIWKPLKRLHSSVAPAACALVHSIVTRLPRGLVGADLALKHTYDYEPVYVHPERIRHLLPVGNWRRGRSAAQGSGRWAEVRRWRTHGGAWKNAKRHVSRNLHGRFVLGGSWEGNRRDFVIHPTIQELFLQGIPPERTSEYGKLRRWVEAGDFRYTRACRSVADIDRYFAELRRSFESIQNDGYLTQDELGESGGDEIRVCVDRGGRLCVYGGGTHRLSIARVLGLERIPVLVKRVHADWVAACLERYGGTVETAIAEGLRSLEDSLPNEGTEKTPTTPPVGGEPC